MITWNIRNFEISHRSTALAVQATNELVTVVATEYDNEAVVALTITEARELADFLNDFLEGKQA